MCYITDQEPGKSISNGAATKKSILPLLTPKITIRGTTSPTGGMTKKGPGPQRQPPRTTGCVAARIANISLVTNGRIDTTTRTPLIIALI